MPFNNRTIRLERINLEDKSFQITTETAMDSLVASIARMGMMHPPVLLGDEACYVVVSGFRRIAACKFLELTEISAKILPPETDRQTCIYWAVADNALQRPLNLIETSRALTRLTEVYAEPDDLCRVARELGLPDNLSAIDKMRQLSGLSVEIQEGVLSNTLSLAMALELGKLEIPAGVAMAQLFGYLKLGLNKQRELLLMIQEIAFRDRLSIHEILNSSDFRSIVDHEKWDRSQKTLKIRQYMKRRRFPSITTAEKNFEDAVRSLSLENGVMLIPPQDFEGNDFCFHLSFHTQDELHHRLSGLTEASNHPALSRILSG
jgi:ParB family chromosome partitioning protein